MKTFSKGKDKGQQIDLLIQSIKNCTGFQEEKFREFIETPAEHSISLNTAKKSILPFPLEYAIPYTNNGFKVSFPQRVSLYPEWHSGIFYVQESSSMFIEYIVKYLHSTYAIKKVLDVCAAPGGKSLLISNALNNECLMVANEIVPKRMQSLIENVIKHGTGNFIITNNRTETIKSLHFAFDLILVDAPCSGSGMSRKDETALMQWSEKLVSDCASTQRKILDDIQGLIKTNGFLIYSTCSFSKEENEDVCDFIVEKFNLENIEIPINSKWQITETLSEKYNQKGYRFWPQNTGGEGFFVSVYKRKDYIKYEEINVINKLIKSSSIINNYLCSNEHAIEINNSYHALSENYVNDFNHIKKHLNIRYAGLEIGELIKNEIIPSAALALSINYNQYNIPCVEIDEETALKFLSRNNIILNNIEQGWNILSYKNNGLGLIKNIGNRVNNYWPKEWRLRNSS